jgi:hypothetical protein
VRLDDVVVVVACVDERDFQAKKKVVIGYFE